MEKQTPCCSHHPNHQPVFNKISRFTTFQFLELLYIIQTPLMWATQCHKPSPSHHNFDGFDHPQVGLWHGSIFFTTIAGIIPAHL
jgi:hypothetical protein